MWCLMGSNSAAAHRRFLPGAVLECRGGIGSGSVSYVGGSSLFGCQVRSQSRKSPLLWSELLWSSDRFALLKEDISMAAAHRPVPGSFESMFATHHSSQEYFPWL
ncbi:unnamed protein product [Cuscuta campestris]|uniref:Uncharacterized protein n=1 Tax=Cuscuta campestris TaxID=132261 RepID=A0A484MZJ3_9ASTE|nr:unnamed protein product [Cuscuta campestris]